MFNLRRRLMMSGSGEYEQLVNYAFLYNESDECSDLTWGWETRAWSFDSSTTPKAVTLTKNKKYMSGSIAGSSAYVSGVIQAGMEIDLYEYDNMYVDFSATGGTETKGYDYLDIYVGDRESSYYYSPEKFIGRLLDLRWNASQSNTVSRRTLKGDISQFNSWHDIYIGFYAYQATISANIYNIYLTKPDDWKKLCNLAGVTPPSTLNELISDTTALNTIFNNERAVNFMLLQCTGDFMVSVLSNEIAVNRLKDSPYLNEIVANIHWAKFMMIIPTAKSIFNFTMLYDGSLGESGLSGANTCSDVTGGFVKNTISSDSTSNYNCDFNQDNIYLRSYKSHRQSTRSNNLINLEGYTRLFAIFDYTNSSNDMTYLRLGLHTNKTVGASNHVNNPDIPSIVYGAKASSNDGVVSGENVKIFDITDDGTSMYFGIAVTSGSSMTTKANVYGVALVKADDFQTLCNKAGITAPSDIATLVADSYAMQAIMSNEEAVKYLMGCTGDLMVAICNSGTAMNILANSIAFDYTVSHPVWYKFMKMCPTSAEFIDNV